MNKRLFRSRQEKVIGGVCGGIADYFDVDPTIVRLATILLVLGLGFPIVAYLVGWIIIPRRPLVAAANMAPQGDSQHEPQPEPQPESPHYAEAAPVAAAEAAPKQEKSGMSVMVPGLAMVAFGLFALLKGYFWWHWEDLLPVGLVVIGIYLIVRHLDLTPSKKNGDSKNGNANGNGEATLSTNATNGGDS